MTGVSAAFGAHSSTAERADPRPCRGAAHPLLSGVRCRLRAVLAGCRQL